MKIKKNDNVIILAGKDRGKKGKVVKSLPSREMVVVEGLNLKKRRQRPRRSNEKGQTLEIPHPIAVSNVAMFCPTCGRGVRLGAKVVGGKKVRVCVKCKREF